MKVTEELPRAGYVVIRCHDCAVVAKFDCFPERGRALMYRNDDKCAFMPLSEDHIVITQKSHSEFTSAKHLKVT